MKRVLLIISLCLFAFNVKTAAQLKVPISECVTPFYDIPYETPLKYTHASASGRGMIPMIIYKDFQCSFALDDSNTEEFSSFSSSTIDAKFLIPESSRYLCVIDNYYYETASDYLVIAEDYGAVNDMLCVQVRDGYAYAKQFRILPDYTIEVYTIIPSTTTPIFIHKFDLNRAASFQARIQVCRYAIENDRFVLKSTVLSKEQVIRSTDFPIEYVKRIRFWDHYDLSE